MSWVFENCFENSSGLLLIVGAPTTSKNERDMVSATYISSLTVPCEHAIPDSPLPSSVISFWLHWGGSKTDRCSRLQLDKGILALPADCQYEFTSNGQVWTNLFIKKSDFCQSRVCGINRSNQRDLLLLVAEGQEVTSWTNTFNPTTPFRTLIAQLLRKCCRKATLVSAVLLSADTILIPL